MVNKCTEHSQSSLFVREPRKDEQHIKHSSSSCRSRAGSRYTSFPFPLSLGGVSKDDLGELLFDLELSPVNWTSSSTSVVSGSLSNMSSTSLPELTLTTSMRSSFPLDVRCGTIGSSVSELNSITSSLWRFTFRTSKTFSRPRFLAPGFRVPLSITTRYLYGFASMAS